MLERFTSLPVEDRREALAVAGGRLRRPVHLLEKDVWVVWTIQTLFQAPFAGCARIEELANSSRDRST